MADQQIQNDGTLDAATMAMPDIDAITVRDEPQEQHQREQEPAVRNDGRDDGRDDKGRFKAKEGEAEAPADKQAAAEDDDDPFVEFPADEEGKEPVREKLSKVWEGYRRSTELEQELQTAKTAQRPMTAVEVQQAVSETVQAREATIHNLQQLHRMIQPVAPDADLTNPASPAYNPELFYGQLQQYQAAQQRASQIAQAIQIETQAAQREQEAITSARMQHEVAKLREVWPELAQESVRNSVQTELAKHYGLDQATINSVADHRFFSLARDALAFRAAKAQEAAAVKKVTAKPKLVPSVARSTQTSQQRAAGEGLSRLRQSGSIEDAAAALDGLI